MSAWPNVYSASATADVNIPTTTETVVATLVVPAVPSAGYKVNLFGTVQVTAGTAATAATPRWRRGTDATGTLVGEGNPVTLAAGNTGEISHNAIDTPGEIAGQSYVLTVQQTAATGNGTALQSAVTAIVN